ncbi:MAG: tetratricopeptide repeat protein [Ignavibacteriota bacterium]
MPGITRKELKTDNVAEGFERGLAWFEGHKKEEVRYGAIALAAAVLIFGFFIYRNHEHAARQEALAEAIRVQETPVANVAVSGQTTFPTQEVKDQAALKAFADVQAKYSGSDEAQIAEYYLGCVHSDQGKVAEAEKNFQNVANNADKNYASLAKTALADIYFSDGRFDQGEKILRDLMDHPTIFVSKDQAAISLAKHLIGRNNAEARKLLAPIKDQRSAISSIAQVLSAQIPPQ